MGPPVTRSPAHSAEAWVADTHSHNLSPANNSGPVVDNSNDSSNPTKMLMPLTTALSDLDYTAVVHGTDAKNLRDAASSASGITNVWYDNHYTSAQLVQRFNDSNSALLQELNNTFEAVDTRISSIPTIAMCSPERHIPQIHPYTGSGEMMQFSIWLRRLEDIMRMRLVSFTSEQKANFLIWFLDGVVREEIEKLSPEGSKHFARIVAHFKKNYFESPQQQHMARQTLSTCRQEPGESATLFANRLLNILRAATSGQDHTTQERVVEEFVARLRLDMRYYVKLDGPTTSEKRLTKLKL
ncbi:hypothetical protein OESDEN_01769 [Oesophagostomum dentatum]|uniref:Retrotransposon gag domain-containing protein n=1 Tax=Oesophagostomum dentatum TaxID=61180 RepID=A0A0B1TR05_OESDE|nr:hypothetical protein OESDEN_01769 [Oesophagostomum dentatum]